MSEKWNSFEIFDYLTNKIEIFAKERAILEIECYKNNKIGYAGPPQQIYQTWDIDTINTVKEELNKEDNSHSLNEYLEILINNTEKEQITSWFVEKFCDLTNKKLDDFARTGLTNEYEIYDYDTKNKIELTKNGNRPSDGWDLLSDQEYIKQLEHGIKLNQESLNHPKNKQNEQNEQIKKTLKR
ncbi:hypothetical protein EELLY_v1c03640 [Entomoplasma ellychniae]|uniref:Uncharacterized protein n=1 Tax=Entomoplasma ellychniae TaxID=2114 RepID=A0A8E2QYM8_9MOLU|nr:hypothetical protein [Entomoplasma ellychniae]PPE04355.1 hypothetical protein EELLY_v1c00290 [Entomoplasma ellychniae]PPE04613.1 hypothetical protein EELLY_v1c02930 [Entomoplasma ellychniae]PPE04684.1 hypothetical protein EELLY_v1c03640 [Entomoplasma ellychniae]